MRKKRTYDFKSTIKKYIESNLKEFCIVILLFLIGIILSIIYINSTNNNQAEQITSYIGEFVNIIKQNPDSIDSLEVLAMSLKENIILVILLWFMGLTVIGVPVVYAIIIFRGFCLGYSISSMVITFGIFKGGLISICALLLQNVIIIPLILSLSVSCIRLYKSIMKDKRRENIKSEIFRHTFLSIFMLIMVGIASLIEVYISNNILISLISNIN